MPADRPSPLRNAVARLLTLLSVHSGRLAPVPGEPLAELSRNREYITRFAFRPTPGT